MTSASRTWLTVTPVLNVTEISVGALVAVGSSMPLMMKCHVARRQGGGLLLLPGPTFWALITIVSGADAGASTGEPITPWTA